MEKQGRLFNQKNYDLYGELAGSTVSPSKDIIAGIIGGIARPVNKVEAPPESNYARSEIAAVSGIGTQITRIPSPIDRAKARELKKYSTHHAACVTSTVNATVGLGFYGRGELEGDISGEDVIKQVVDAQGNPPPMPEIINLLKGNYRGRSQVSKELDPLCFGSFNEHLIRVAQDFKETGVGYLEVTRGLKGQEEKITGVRWITSSQIDPMVMVDESTGIVRIFYENLNARAVPQDVRYYSMFGLENKRWLLGENGPYKGTSVGATELGNASWGTVSEIIPFINPSNMCSPYTGYPDWLAAVPDIDLTKISKQYKADFYSNRGVLDYIIWVMGAGNDTSAVEDAVSGIVQESVGGGNNHKSGVIALSDPDAKAQIDKLAMGEQTEEQFSSDMEILAQNIVSAHRVPPLLANILIPGKLGATNELINAIIFFQLLTVGPYQNIFENQLMTTLGDKDENGELDLEEDDFHLRTITSQINITGLDTLSRMRSEGMDGNQNEDRDLEEGVKE